MKVYLTSNRNSFVYQNFCTASGDWPTWQWTILKSGLFGSGEKAIPFPQAEKKQLNFATMLSVEYYSHALKEENKAINVCYVFCNDKIKWASLNCFLTTIFLQNLEMLENSHLLIKRIIRPITNTLNKDVKKEKSSKTSPPSECLLEVVFSWSSQADQEQIAFVKIGKTMGKYNREWNICLHDWLICTTT